MNLPSAFNLKLSLKFQSVHVSTAVYPARSVELREYKVSDNVLHLVVSFFTTDVFNATEPDACLWQKINESAIRVNPAFNSW